MDNVNDRYFDGIYKEIWKAMIPEQLTAKEADFLISYFHLGPGTTVLDLMCGYGRHSIALAEKGIPVVAVDNLESYINEIRLVAEQRSLPITCYREDILAYTPAEKVDLAICMGNSLNFFRSEEVGRILRQIHPALRPGGSLLINSWSLLEIVGPGVRESSTGTIAGIGCNTLSKRLPDPDRIESLSTFTLPDGRVEHKKAVDYILSLEEYRLLLEDSGFRLEEVFSIPGKKKFAPGDPRVYIIASRV